MGAPKWPEAIRSSGGLCATGQLWLASAHIDLPVVMHLDMLEVQFSDRNGVNSHKAVPLLRVCRSRTRVWGAKMITCHRSLPR